MAKKNVAAEENEGGFQLKAKSSVRERAKPVVISLTSNQIAHITALASDNGLKRADLVRQCLCYGLDQLGHPLPKN